MCQVQADWQQNDETANDYVKNRPGGYIDNDTIVKIPEKYLDIKNTNIVNGSKTGSLRTVGSTEESSKYTLGDYAFAEGQATKALGNCSHVQGKFNIEDNNNEYADIIGNGSSNTERSNAATVDWDGNAWYAGDVYIGSTSGANKDEGSKKLATEEYVNSAIASTESNVIPNLENRYILFIGDSYATNFKANNWNGWCKSCIQFISSALGGVSESFKNEHYKVAAIGGSGFYAGTTAVTLLNNFISNNPDFMTKVTDIVFAYGYNDASAVSAAVSSDSRDSIYQTIKDNIAQCHSIIINQTQHYVNKYLFAVGWGSNPYIRWYADRLYKSVYNYSATLGWIYADLHYIMLDPKIYYEDYVHPNSTGSDKIAERILNVMLGNSNIITPIYQNVKADNGNDLGTLSVINDNLVQLWLSAAVIYSGDLVTIDAYNTVEICELVDVYIFGSSNLRYFTPVSFHIVDRVNNTDQNVILYCSVTAKKYKEVDESHTVYKSYLSIKNVTNSQIKFTHIAPNNGCVNISTML